MNLVAFSLRTKGAHNFLRRLWTVFARFGLSEHRTARSLQTLVATLGQYGAYPTFFIPAVVLRRHVPLLRQIAASGAEIGIHGYVHNDYRSLTPQEQERQTRLAISVFRASQIPFAGFRNPYLGWTEEALEIFAALNFTYESNEAVIHDVIDLETLSPLLRSGYEKSLRLFQAVPPSIYDLRPHCEGHLVRLPTSIPDDEMLFDRLRITEPQRIAAIWSAVMARVYALGGLYALNLHPERALLCQAALRGLLDYATSQPEPVWIARLEDIARWWLERSRFRFEISPAGPQQWRVRLLSSARAQVQTRQLTVLERSPVEASKPPDTEDLEWQEWRIEAARCPAVALSPATPPAVRAFLQEQGYAVTQASPEEAANYSLFLDLPAGLGASPREQRAQRRRLVAQLEALSGPLLSFAPWPATYRAALAISSDIDSVTIQDFFLRIVEVARASHPQP
ncbi:polysaccharide deacetylase family protein [Thermogemmatispora sp.]|uniref:polysaccharide deacetylase family protein n=1 Tax=Thermogemmatispora sp. TaxID=1968838 RepID=UPI0035E45414